MHIYDLDTPALVIDLDVLERNIANMAAHCQDLGIALRVHTKTHKIPEIARMQLAAGSQGIVCQKVGEAEVMARAGIRDILIPYNILGPQKLRRLTALARMARNGGHSAITVAADSEETVRGLSAQAAADGATIRVLVEVDTGGGRCGVQTPEAARDLGRLVADLPGLELVGMMTFPSNPRAQAFFDCARDLWARDGLPCEVLSGGGTGLEAVSKELGFTEHRSGSYAYEGLTRIKTSADLTPERCALRVIVTVVSAPTPDRIIIDGGQKTFESYPPKPYGLVVEHPAARIQAMSVEHGHVDVSACDHRFRVGEKLSVIPLHQGKVTNMHDEVAAARNGEVVCVWDVAGRGKVR